MSWTPGRLASADPGRRVAEEPGNTPRDRPAVLPSFAVCPRLDYGALRPEFVRGRRFRRPRLFQPAGQGAFTLRRWPSHRPSRDETVSWRGPTRAALLIAMGCAGSIWAQEAHAPLDYTDVLANGLALHVAVVGEGELGSRSAGWPGLGTHVPAAALHAAGVEPPVVAVRPTGRWQLGGRCFRRRVEPDEPGRRHRCAARCAGGPSACT